MSDHSFAVRSRSLTRFQVLCRCGWQSEWSDSQDAAEAMHEAHVELAEPIPPRFSDRA